MGTWKQNILLYHQWGVIITALFPTDFQLFITNVLVMATTTTQYWVTLFFFFNTSNLACPGTRVHQSVTLELFPSIFSPANRIWLQMDHFCCYSFRFACIIWHFPKCFEIFYINCMNRIQFGNAHWFFVISFGFTIWLKGILPKL